MYFDFLGCSSPRSEGGITLSAHEVGSPLFDSDRPAPSGFAPPVDSSSGEQGMMIARSPQTSVINRLTVDSRQTRSHSLDRGRIRLTARNHLPLPLTGNIAIKQPRHSLPQLLLFQILRLFSICRNPRHKVLPLGPRCVMPLGYPLPPDPYYQRGRVWVLVQARAASRDDLSWFTDREREGMNGSSLLR